jgi:hypothetical protein
MDTYPGITWVYIARILAGNETLMENENITDIDEPRFGAGLGTWEREARCAVILIN